MIKKIYGILFKEGIINFIKRKKNISYLDSKTLFTIDYRQTKTKIWLNRKFGFVDMAIFKNGIYEKDIVDDIVNVLDKNKVMLDIGANIGQHSLLASHFCKEVYSFEPAKEVYEQFKSSIKANNITNIKPYNLAIGDKKETKKFNFQEDHAGASSFIGNDGSNKKQLIVQIDTLQNILQDKKFHVMKIDVEGYEAVVVLGNKGIILSNNPIIFLEYAPKSISDEGSRSPSDLFSFFIENNFSIYSRTLGRTVGKRDFDDLGNDNWIIKPR